MYEKLYNANMFFKIENDENANGVFFQSFICL